MNQPVAPDAIAVIDAGTSALRAVAVSAGGRVEPIASEPWPLFVPEDAAPFGREFHTGAVEDALRRLLDAISVHGSPIAALSLTGQREGLAFLDAAHTALFASPNIDARASAEGIEIDGRMGDDVYHTTGHLPSLMQAPAKLAWMRANRPAVAARIAAAVPLVDWLAAVAGGAVRASRTLAAENGLLEISTGSLASGLLERLGCPASLVPPIVPDGTVVGRWTSAALAGVPIVLAGADTQCALIGMGAHDDGDCGVPAGWSAPLQLVTASPVSDCDMRTWTSVHSVSGRWILESNAGETGRAWDWVCSMLGVIARDADALAAEAAPGSADAMAVLGPRAMRASRMSAGMGALTMPLPLVMSAPDRPQLLRSALESTAYAIRANLEQIEAISGVAVKSLRVGGGLSRGGLFTQILADVIDRPVEVAASAETSALGAAALASAALGWNASVQDAVDAMTGGHTVEPRPRVSTEYDDYYARWCALADGLERIATEGA